MKVKWTKFAIDAYKKTGDQMRTLGFKPLRDIQDADGQSVLSFWSGIDGAVIQQTWTDTGDVVLYRTITELELDGMMSTLTASEGK